MDPDIWTCQCWPIIKNLFTSALSGHWMKFGRPTGAMNDGDGWRRESGCFLNKDPDKSYTCVKRPLMINQARSKKNFFPLRVQKVWKLEQTMCLRCCFSFSNLINDLIRPILRHYIFLSIVVQSAAKNLLKESMFFFHDSPKFRFPLTNSLN